MLDIIFIVLILLAIILMLYSIEERNSAFCITDSALWLILALFMVQGIETPYQIYNASSTVITTGLQTITSNLAPISYLFMGFGAVMFLLFVTFTFELFTEEKKKNR